MRGASAPSTRWRGRASRQTRATSSTPSTIHSHSTAPTVDRRRPIISCNRRSAARARRQLGDTPCMAHASEPRETTDPPSEARGDEPPEPPRAVVEGTHWSLVDVTGDVLSAPGPDDVRERLDRGTFFWLDIPQPSKEDIDLLRDVFAFHPLALEDSAHFDQRPKIDTYDDFAFLVVYGATDDADGLVEVHCFSSERFLVTVRRDSCPAFVRLQQRYMERGDALHDETMLLYHVVDGLVDSFFPALADLDDTIDDLETQIFERAHESQLRQIFHMKQRLVGLRKMI